MKNPKKRKFFVGIFLVFLAITVLLVLIGTSNPIAESWLMSARCRGFFCQIETIITLHNPNHWPTIGYVSFYSSELEKYTETTLLSENQQSFIKYQKNNRLFFFFYLSPRQKNNWQIKARRMIHNNLSLPEISISGKKPVKRQYQLKFDPDYQNVENSLQLPINKHNGELFFELADYETVMPVFRWKYQQLFPIFGFMG